MMPTYDPAALYETVRLSQAQGYTPAHRELARALGMSPSSVTRYLARLEGWGLVTVHDRQSRYITLRRDWTEADEAHRGDWQGHPVYARAIPVPRPLDVADRPRHVKRGLYRYDPRVVYDFVAATNRERATGPTLREVAQAMADARGVQSVSTSIAGRALEVLLVAGLVVRRGDGRAAGGARSLFVARPWTEADEALRATLRGDDAR